MASSYFEYLTEPGDESAALVPNRSSSSSNPPMAGNGTAASNATPAASGSSGFFSALYGGTDERGGGGTNLPSFGGGGHSTTQDTSGSGPGWFGFGGGESKPAKDNSMLSKLNSAYEDWTIPQNQWIAFGVLFGAGLFFLFLSSFAFPWLAVAPAKFAALFSLGSVCMLGSFAALRGPEKFLIHCTETREKQTITAIYLGSLVFTLWFSFFSSGGYLYTLVSVIVQLVALLYFLFSYIPGGKTALDWLFGSCFGCCCPSWFGGSGSGNRGRAMGAR